MKKIIAFILSLCMIFALCACGAEKTVPDKTIEWAVEDYLNSEAYGYLDYKTHITHDPDKKTKTDTVGIELEITFPNCLVQTSSKSTYQYNKSSELWEQIRGGSWEPYEIIKTNISNSLDEWNRVCSYIDDYSWDFDFYYDYTKDIDYVLALNLSEIVDDDSISRLISDYWYEEGEADFGSNSYYSYQMFSVYCCCTPSLNNARQLFELLCDGVKSDFGGVIQEAYTGDSFNLCNYYVDNYYSTGNILCIQNETDVFFITYSRGDNILFNILKMVGFELPDDVFYGAQPIPFFIESVPDDYEYIPPAIEPARESPVETEPAVTESAPQY